MVKKADLDNMGKMTAKPRIKDVTIVAMDETYSCEPIPHRSVPWQELGLGLGFNWNFFLINGIRTE